MNAAKQFERAVSSSRVTWHLKRQVQSHRPHASSTGHQEEFAWSRREYLVHFAAAVLLTALMGGLVYLATALE